MFVKIMTAIYLEVEDKGQAEEACLRLDSSFGGLEDQLAGFPHGECIGVNVDNCEEVGQEELEEQGFTE